MHTGKKLEEEEEEEGRDQIVLQCKFALQKQEDEEKRSTDQRKDDRENLIGEEWCIKRNGKEIRR